LLNKKMVTYFGAACLPAYLLSVLWAALPWYIYILAVGAVLLQFKGLWHFIQLLRKSYPYIKTCWQTPVKVLYMLAFSALVIKLTLQAGSTIPEISKLAFGFRSVVIAYLHLVLLGIITLFLLGHVYHAGYFRPGKMTVIGLSLFCIGVFLNELILMIQGICSFSYQLIPYLNESLFMVSVLMLGSLVSLVFCYRTVHPN
jgi:hypothetical protein